MTKTELAAAVSQKAELSKKDAAKALSAFIDVVQETLSKGEDVRIIGFGTFEVRKRKARKGRNPQTGKRIRIKASKNAAFRAGKLLKESVNK